MKKILVPTDFSDNASKAVDYAVAIANKANAGIILLNAFAAVDSSLSPAKGILEEYNNIIIADAKEKLQALKEKTEKKSAAKISTKFFKGSISESILKCATEENADLIVMGTRGASGINRMLWGSTTANIIGISTIPVLAIPIKAQWNGINNILIATRQFSADDKTLIPVLELAEMEEALVHIAVFTDTDDKDLTNYLEHARLLNAYQDTLPTKFKHIKFKTEHLEGKEFDDTIMKYINEYSIDMLVMTTHTRGFWDRIFNRSMTRSMAYHTKIPLLAIPVE
ncbi:MAG: universal stress protein [Bacteroidetes bacterium]|nr:universal stress protein [Bacteroidota bacterium]